MKTKDSIKLDIVKMNKSEPYPKEKCFLMVVYIDIYTSLVTIMEIKKDGPTTLTVVKIHTVPIRKVRIRELADEAALWTEERLTTLIE